MVDFGRESLIPSGGAKQVVGRSPVTTPSPPNEKEFQENYPKKGKQKEIFRSSFCAS
jgi:hypothetical protein